MHLTWIVLPLLCCGFDEPAQRKEPASKQELAATTERGRMLAGYDAAAWHASDALKAKNPPEANLGRYIARKTKNGWSVAFGRLTKERDRFLVAYEAIAGKDATSFEVKSYDPPQSDTGFLRSAARAMDLVLADFLKTFQGERHPYNAMVLPAPKSALWVYLVPAPTKPGIWPLGGDVRYLVSADGLRIQAKRKLHNAIIERAPPPAGDPSQVAAGFHTHVLDEVPEDTDVFHVLSRQPPAPEIIATEQFVYVVEPDGNIKYLGKPADVLGKRPGD